MKKQELAKDIIHYRFDPRPGKIFDTSATAILNGKKAILIDTGYESQTPLLLEDLAKNDIEVEAVILTHFHDDHMEGLKLLPGIPIYGSGHYQEILDLWIAKEDHSYFLPSVIINEPFLLSYGDHHLTLTPHPGHSACGTLISINNQFLHVGDEIIFTADGVPLLPIVDDITKDAKVHLESLNKLRDYGKFTIIPSHGPVFDGKDLINDIENRCAYLKALLNSNKVISFEDATKNCTYNFVNNGWHEGNCR